MSAFSPIVVAVLLMTVSATTIAVGNTLIRSVGDIGIHPFEIAFFRCAFGFATVAPIVLWQARAWPKITAVSVLRPLVPLISFCWPLKKLKNTSRAAWVRIEK